MLKLKISILIILLVSPFVQSMRFEMLTGTTKCISDDIKLNAMNVGKYSVLNPNEGYPLPDLYKITIQVTSPRGTSYHYLEQVESGNFAFTAAEEGDFSACFFTANHNPPLTLSIDFEWKSGLVDKDWSKVAKKGQVDGMEYELQRLYDVVTSIHDEMNYLRLREEEMQDLNIATNSKMALFSFLSLIICLSVAALQLWHLKNFFEGKKIL